MIEQTISVFVFVQDNEPTCIRAFAKPGDAEKFAIPYVAEKIGFELTGDDNADWDAMNTELDKPEGSMWQLRYELPVE